MGKSVRNFDHQMRGRPDRCETCGAPLPFWSQVWASTRCPRCQTRNGLTDLTDLASIAPLSDAELERPIDEPMRDAPRHPYALDDGLNDGIDDQPTLPTWLASLSSIEEQSARLHQAAAEARSLAEQNRAELAVRVEGDLPAFPLDSRCAICCAIMTEYRAGHTPIRPTARDYRCARHGTDWRRYDPDTGDYRPDGWHGEPNGDGDTGQSGQEAAS